MSIRVHYNLFFKNCDIYCLILFKRHYVVRNEQIMNCKCNASHWLHSVYLTDYCSGVRLSMYIAFLNVK